MFIQYIDCNDSSNIFTVPMWFMYNYMNALCCCVDGIMILLPLSATGSMTGISS